MRIVLFLPILLVPLASALKTGNPANAEQEKFVVYLECSVLPEHGGGQKRCLGSIVAPRWILTAYHCIATCSSVRAIIGNSSANERKVYTDLRNSKMYPSYTKIDRLSTDLALLKTVLPISFGTDIDKVSVNAGAFWDKGSFVAVGKQRKSSSNKILQTGITLASQADCKAYVTERMRIADGQQLNYHPQESACTINSEPSLEEGDSGSPVLLQNTLVGIYTGGSDSRRTGKSYNFFVPLQNKVNWIYSIIGGTPAHS